MPSYHIADINNISQQDINALMVDSLQNKSIYPKVMQALKFDYISEFCEYRITSDSQFYFHGTQSKEKLKDTIRLNAFFIPTMFLKKESYYFRVIDEGISIVVSNFKHGDSHAFKRIIFERMYATYKEVSYFKINADYFDSLSYQMRANLCARLNSSINMLKALANRNNLITFDWPQNYIEELKDYDLNTSHEKLRQDVSKHFDIRTSHIDYIQEIATGGSAKDIAIRLNKSPRTVEKTMDRLQEKFNLESKDELKLFSRVIVSYFTGIQ